MKGKAFVIVNIKAFVSLYDNNTTKDYIRIPRERPTHWSIGPFNYIDAIQWP